MNKLVKKVTVVEGRGTRRKAKVVYEDRQEDYPTIPMDDIVRCVTVIRGSGATREAKTIFKSPHWPDREVTWQSVERGVRRFLKADMIRAQEAYHRHVESAHDAGKTWWLDMPANIARSFIEASEKAREERADEAKSEAKGETKSPTKGG
jgi:hypothetical protein